MANYFPSCGPCNVSKGGRDIEYLRISLAIRRSPLRGIITAAVADKLMAIEGVTLPISIEKFHFEIEGENFELEAA